MKLTEDLKAVDGVTAASRKADEEMVEARIAGLDGSLYVTDSLAVVERVSKSLAQQAASALPATVRIVFTGPAVDRLGHTRQEPFLTLTFPGADLAHAEMSNLGYGRQLDLASNYNPENAAGVEALQSFCTGKLGGEDSVTCAAILAGAQRWSPAG